MAKTKLAEEKAQSIVQIRCKEQRFVHGTKKECNQLLAEVLGNFTPKSVILHCDKCKKKVTV